MYLSSNLIKIRQTRPLFQRRYHQPSEGGQITWFYSGAILNVARPDMNNYATLGVMLYCYIKVVLYKGYSTVLPSCVPQDTGFRRMAVQIKH